RQAPHTIFIFFFHDTATTDIYTLSLHDALPIYQEKMGVAIHKLAQEDPTFRVNTDPETGQTILSGMGELHLEIIVDRMMREFGRSEEHTSELQSRGHLVCRLLLEKKKHNPRTCQ